MMNDTRRDIMLGFDCLRKFSFHVPFFEIHLVVHTLLEVSASPWSGFARTGVALPVRIAEVDGLLERK